MTAPTLAFAGAEPRETNSGLPERWITPSVTVTLDPSLDDLAPGAADEIEAAMTTWYTDVVGIPRARFVRGTTRAANARDGVSTILAAPITVAGHEHDLAITTTYAADDTGDILEADVVFNTEYAYAVMPAPTTSCAQVFDVGAVATHESGHFFGLGEDYDDHAATMYLHTMPCDAHKRALTDDDTAAIAELYKPPDSLVAHCDASPVRTRSNAWFVAMGFAAAVIARRMRRDDARRSDDARARR